MYRVKAVYREEYGGEVRTVCTMYSEEYATSEQAEQTADFIGGSLDERMADYWIETTIQTRGCGDECGWREAIPAC